MSIRDEQTPTIVGRPERRWSGRGWTLLAPAGARDTVTKSCGSIYSNQENVLPLSARFMAFENMMFHSLPRSDS
jgi:hypothetical protein